MGRPAIKALFPPSAAFLRATAVGWTPICDPVCRYPFGLWYPLALAIGLLAKVDRADCIELSVLIFSKLEMNDVTEAV